MGRCWVLTLCPAPSPSTPLCLQAQSSPQDRCSQCKPGEEEARERAHRREGTHHSGTPASHTGPFKWLVGRGCREVGGAQRASPKGPSPHMYPQMCGQATSEDWDIPSHAQAGQGQGRTWSPRSLWPPAPLPQGGWGCCLSSSIHPAALPEDCLKPVPPRASRQWPSFSQKAGARLALGLHAQP